MKVTVITILIGALDKVTEESVQGMAKYEKRGQMEIIQTTALLRSSRRVLEI